MAWPKDKDRFKMNPSAAQEGANRLVGSAAKVAQGAVGMIGNAASRVNRDFIKQNRSLGRAAATDDEMQGSGFKYAPGQRPLDKAPSVNPSMARIPRPQAGVAQAATSPALRQPGQSTIQPGKVNTAPEYTPGNRAALTTAYSINPGQENSRIGRTFTDGPASMTVTGPPPRTLNDGRPLPTNGTYKTGNGLEVSFPQGSSQREMRAFLRQPTQPGTRMRSNMPGKEEQFFGATPVESGKPKDPMSGMGFKERIEYRQTEAMREGNRLNAETMLATKGIDNKTATERNAIDRMNVESQDRLRGVQGEQANVLTSQMKREQGTPKSALTDDQYFEANEKRMQMFQESMEGSPTEKGGFLGFGKEKVPGRSYEDWLAENDPAFYKEYSRRAGGDGIAGALSVINKNPQLAAQYQNATPEQRKALLARIMSDEG